MSYLLPLFLAVPTIYVTLKLLGCYNTPVVYFRVHSVDDIVEDWEFDQEIAKLGAYIEREKAKATSPFLPVCLPRALSEQQKRAVVRAIKDILRSNRYLVE